MLGGPKKGVGAICGRGSVGSTAGTGGDFFLVSAGVSIGTGRQSSLALIVLVENGELEQSGHKHVLVLASWPCFSFLSCF